MISRLILIKASLAVAALMEIQNRKQEQTMSPPRDPTQIPPGDLGDAVKRDPAPTPSDFNDDEDDGEESFDDEADDEDSMNPSAD